MGFYRCFHFYPLFRWKVCTSTFQHSSCSWQAKPIFDGDLMIHFGGLLSLRYFYKYIYIYIQIYIYIYINTYRGPITSGTFWCQKVIPRYLSTLLKSQKVSDRVFHFIRGKTSGFVAKSQCVWRPFRSELPVPQLADAKPEIGS